MKLAGLLVFSALAGVCRGVIFSHQCGKSGTTFTITVLVDLEGDSRFEYMTFKNSSGAELIDGCSTTSGQINGTGTTADPFRIEIVVDSVADINLGDPDCGHQASGNVLSWTVFVLQTFPPPVVGANGLEQEEVLSCDYDQVTENPSVNLTVDFTNTTLDNLTTTIVIAQLSRNVRMLLAGVAFAELSPPYIASSIGRIALEIDDTSGLYAYNLIACNTPVCDDLFLPILNADGCKDPMFTELLSGTPGAFGTVMPRSFFLPPPNPLIAVTTGKAYTETFFLFRFVRSPDVYFRTNIGYCATDTDPDCIDHCGFVMGKRKKREAPTVDSYADRMTAVFSFEASKAKYLIDYPDGTSQYPTIRHTSPEVESCTEKPGFVAVLALLGTAALASVIVALGFGLKLSNESGKICGYW